MPVTQTITGADDRVVNSGLVDLTARRNSGGQDECPHRVTVYFHPLLLTQKCSKNLYSLSHIFFLCLPWDLTCSSWLMQERKTRRMWRWFVLVTLSDVHSAGNASCLRALIRADGQLGLGNEVC